MIIPFITDLANEPAVTVKDTSSSESADIKDNLLSGDNIFSVKFQSMVNNMDDSSVQSQNKTESENKSDTDLSFNDKYELILKRIEKERFERELITGSR